MNSKDTFLCNIHTKQVITDCVRNPTEVSRPEAWWLYANNDKYDLDELNPAKIGKWMIFSPKADVDSTWNKIKEAVREGHLWSSKVSATDPARPTHVIIIYTKDYTNIDDVVEVLNYLETSGIKPANTIIRYKTDEQTRANIYSGGTQKASIYDSDTIKLKYMLSKARE